VDGDSNDYGFEEGKGPTNLWTPVLFSLKVRIEQEFGCQFNGVLLNLYRNHNDSVAWHRDKERAGMVNGL
jgi:alkylated DNA repair dioxygenase AlkB